jgi:hypothetical protein
MKKIQKKLRLRLETLHDYEAPGVIGGTFVSCGPPVYTSPGLNTFSPGQPTHSCPGEQAIEN